MVVEFFKKIYQKDPQTVKGVTECCDSPRCSGEAGRKFDLQRRSQRSEIKGQTVRSTDAGEPR